MEYNYSEDSLTKSTADYNTLGEPNPLIASLPAFNPYPSMSYQYKNVTNEKVVLGYDALSHGPYSGSGYGNYDVSYPSACSSYYVMRCPSQQIVQEVTNVTTASPSPSPSQPTVPMDIMTALKNLQINAYLDTSTMMGSKIGALLHSWGISKVVTVLPVQNSGYKAEMMSRGGTDAPYFFSNATGKSFQGIPSSINALLHSLSKSPSMPPSMPPKDMMMMTKEGYDCQSCGVSKKNQPKIDNYQSPQEEVQVVYFLFHSKRCGHCKDLVQFLENDPNGQELVKKMNINVVDLDDLQKPEFATAFSHLQDLVVQVQGTPSLMRGKFDKKSGKFAMLPGDNPLLGKPMDVEKAFLSYHAEYELTIKTK
jgi:hypothetical protein